MTVKVYTGVLAVAIIGLNGLKIYNHVQNQKFLKHVNQLKRAMDMNNVLFYEIVDQCAKSKEFPVRYILETNRGVFEI